MEAPEAAALPEGVIELIPAYLARQRWYAGDGAPLAVAVVWAEALAVRAGHRLLRAVVECGGERYQLLIGERPNGEAADFLKGHEGAVLGSVGPAYYYDAAFDPELALALLQYISGGREHAERVRPITAQQSNTSLVYDDRVILKLFRRLQAGRNPDVEVNAALAEAGFGHVAAPVAVSADGYGDLAFAQHYLAGGSEGWALALTSLRDLYDQPNDPEAAGGDFAGEALRLGRITGQMHLALAGAFGVEREGPAAERWRYLPDAIEERLADAVAALGGGLSDAAARFVAALRSLREPGPAIRVHGDYHLGQVMWTDDGWYVLDFEGEPARPIAERTELTSPLKDVAGMLRSFHYAAQAALGDHRHDEAAALSPVASAWEARNRSAFLDAYRSTPGISGLLPATEVAWQGVLAAYEMDKALYELGYERAYRPEWISIPLRAIAGLLTA